MSRELQEGMDRAIAVGDVHWLLMPDDEREMVMRYVNKALAAARPVIKRETREACAKMADAVAANEQACVDSGNSVIGPHKVWTAQRIAAAIRKDSHDDDE